MTPIAAGAGSFSLNPSTRDVVKQDAALVSRIDELIERSSLGTAGAKALRERTEPQALGEIVKTAVDGDAEAWKELVRRYDGPIRAVARSYRLSETDAADVVQSTWLRALEHLKSLRNPEAVGPWLLIAARRQCLAMMRNQGCQVPHGLRSSDVPAPDTDPEVIVLGREEQHLVRHAVAELPTRSRILVTALFADKEVRYHELAAALDVPVGSIGPTRSRVLRKLRTNLTQVGFDESDTPEQRLA